MSPILIRTLSIIICLDSWLFAEIAPLYRFDSAQHHDQFIPALHEETHDGQNWNGEWQLIGPNGGRVSAITVGATKDTLMIGTIEGGAYSSIDGGQNWTPWLVDKNWPPSLVTCCITSSKKSIYIGTLHGFYESTNFGKSWHPLITSLTAFFNSAVVHPNNSNILFVGCYDYFDQGYPKGVIRSDDGGRTWAEYNQGLQSTSIILLSPSLYHPETLYACTQKGLYVTDSGGLSGWRKISHGVKDGYVLAFAQNPLDSNHLVMGTLDGVYESQNHGDSWEPIASPFFDSPEVRAVAFTQNRSLYVGTSHGLYKREGDRSTWLDASAGLENRYITVIRILDDRHTLLGTMDGFYQSEDGLSWEKRANGMYAVSCASLAADGESAWVGTKGSGIYQFEAGGWRPVLANSKFRNIYDLHFNHQDQHLYAAYIGDYVDSFEKAESGVLALSLNDPQNSYTDFRLNHTYVHQVATCNKDLCCFYVGCWDGLYRTMDRGQTFNKVTNLPKLGIRSVVIADDEKESIYIGTEFDNEHAAHGVYKSNDSGQTWQYKTPTKQISAVEQICINPQNPQNLIAASLHQGVLISRDGGDTWKQDIFTFGARTAIIYAVLIHPQYANWYFAGGTACFWSSDAGETWSHLPPLPDGAGEINDLLIDPQNPLRLYAATSGRGMIAFEFDAASVSDRQEVVTSFALLTNYPNPFNGGTTLCLNLAKKTDVVLAIYDLRGKMVWELTQTMNAGEQRISWNGVDLKGAALPSGIYLLRAESEGAVFTQKMALIR